MHLGNRSERSLFVAFALSSLLGCGSSPNSIGGPTSTASPAAERGASWDLSGNASASPGQEADFALQLATESKNLFSHDPNSGAFNVSFADLNLKTLKNIESISDDDISRLPDRLKSLDGSKIRIRGHMYPTVAETVYAFLLDHSARLMNFGADPKVYERLEVHLTSRTATVRVERSIEVIGIFRIAPIVLDGKLERLYLLEDAVVVADKAAPDQP